MDPSRSRRRCGPTWADWRLSADLERQPRRQLGELTPPRVAIGRRFFLFVLECGELVLLIRELTRVTLRERLLLGAAAQGFHVLPQALLISIDLRDLRYHRGEVRVSGRHSGPLVDQRLQGAPQRGFRGAAPP